MAKAIAKTKTKKRKWYKIVAPKLFNEAEIGESYVTDSELILGRGFSVNLMNITGNPKNQNISIGFKVKELKEGKAVTYATGYEMSLGSIKRFVRRGRDKMDDSFKLRTKEGMLVRVKPIIVTNNNTSNSVLTTIRLAARKMLKEECAKANFNALINMILKTELQRKLKGDLSKVYPVRNFEIRVFKLVDPESVPEEYTVKKPQAEKKEADKKEDSKKESAKQPAAKKADKDSKKEENPAKNADKKDSEAAADKESDKKESAKKSKDKTSKKSE